MLNKDFPLILYVKNIDNLPPGANDVMERKGVETKENEYLPSNTWIIFERKKFGALVKYISTGDGEEYEIKQEFREEVTKNFNKMMYEEAIYSENDKDYLSFGVVSFLNIKKTT